VALSHTIFEIKRCKVENFQISLSVGFNSPTGTLTLSVLSDIYARQRTILADVHIRPGITGSCELIILGRIVSAAENNKNG